MNNGNFILSLDFELMWGVRDKRSIENYGDSLKEVEPSLIRTLKAFREASIKATFASVGLLFYKDKTELVNDLPKIKPTYLNSNLSPYPNIDNYIDDGHKKCYFGKDLIEKIKEEKIHEIATHTHCHYYCLEDGQTLEQFKADIEKAIGVAQKSNIQINSIVFPRNQYDDTYLKVCKELGILSYRGNEKHKIYKSSKGEEQSLKQRFLRLIDSYINLTGHHCYSFDSIEKSLPINLHSSRFLRPYNEKLSFLEKLKLNRIKKSMTYAARNNLVYHIWWHPHNFGRNTDKNIIMLNKILKHYTELNKKYGFQSVTMQDLSHKIVRSK